MRVLVVEDDDRVAAALCSVLSRHGFDIARARTGRHAVELLSVQPDLVLLDLGLPDRDGFDVCSDIRRVSNVPIIAVTARAEMSARVHGLYLGADDYVVKPYDLRELIARIHSVVRRARPDLDIAATGPAEPTSGGGATAPAGDGPRPTEIGGVRIDPARREVTVSGRPVELTRKEFDLLAELARAPGVVFRREQIISAVWSSSMRTVSRTLEVHVASLRAKLGEPSVVQTVRGVGYRLAAPAVIPAGPAVPAVPVAARMPAG
ncbi:MAG: response regulator transcription factor [Frankia sp.]